MKFGVPTLALLLPAVCFAQVDNVSPYSKKKVFRDAKTHEQLVKHREEMIARNPKPKLTPVEGNDPAKANPPSSFLKESDIICFNGVATFVPKGAILTIPPNLKDRLAMQSGSRLVGWTEFLTLNRGWVTPVEVDRAQAKGSKKIEDKTSELIAKSTNLMVATFTGRPIAMVAPKDKVVAVEPKPTSP
jgi:hypothetical protein